MSMSEYARAFAGRWTPRRAEEPASKPLPESVAQIVTQMGFGLEDVPSHSTPRAACTLMVGERVYVSRRWWSPIERVEIERPATGPAQVLLHLTSGTTFISDFDYEYVSRDAEEQAAAAAKDGAL